MKQILRKLTYLVIITLSIISCQNESIEDEDINETSQGSLLIQRNIDPQLTDNTSLNNALNSVRKRNISINQKTVSVSDQYIIHTETSNYMESGAYHSYTFPVENLIDTTVVQNLMLSYKGDGVYDSYLFTYNNLTIEEKEQIALGNNVDLSGRVEVSLFEDQDWNEQRTVNCTDEVNITETSCGFIGEKPDKDHPGCFLENGEPVTFITITVTTVCSNSGSGSGGGSGGGSGSSGSGSTGGGGGGTNPNPNNTNTVPPEEPEPCDNQSIDLGNGQCATGVTLPIVIPPLNEEEYFENNLEEWIVFDELPGDIINLNEYLECFSDAPTTADFKLTIYVDQPVANQDDTWANDGSLFNPDINVGHTFIGLEMNDSGSITNQTIGFYPATGVDPVSPSTNGAWVDDSNHHYDVSSSINLNHNDFTTLINNISNLGTPQYNLNSLNCTDAGIQICNSAGMNLPDTNGSWPGGSGSNPGNLGQDIRSLNSNNVTTNTNGGIAPTANGPCN